MLAMINKFFGAKYSTYKAGKLRKSEFFILPLFPLFTLSSPFLPYWYHYEDPYALQ